eukprot:2048339-Pleurochrysis_carterae.AAC.1
METNETTRGEQREIGSFGLLAEGRRTRCSTLCAFATLLKGAHHMRMRCRTDAHLVKVGPDGLVLADKRRELLHVEHAVAIGVEFYEESLAHRQKARAKIRTADFQASQRETHSTIRRLRVQLAHRGVDSRRVSDL